MSDWSTKDNSYKIQRLYSNRKKQFTRDKDFDNVPKKEKQKQNKNTEKVFMV